MPQLVERLAHLGKPYETKMSLPSSFSPWLLQNFDCWLMLPLKAKIGRDLFLFPLRGLLVIYTPAVFLPQHISSCLHSFFAVDIFRTAITHNKLYFTNSHCLYILLHLICTLKLTVYRNTKWQVNTEARLSFSSCGFIRCSWASWRRNRLLPTPNCTWVAPSCMLLLLTVC